MATLQELQAQRDALTREIEQMQAQSRTAALKEIQTLMTDYGITIMDLGPRKVASAATRTPVAPKYRDHSTGATWSGRGLQPKWLTTALKSGRTLQEFLIPTTAVQ